MVDSCGGFGQFAFGRSEFGQPKSSIVTKYYSSIPVDGAINVPIENKVLKCLVYCFSSMIQENTLEITATNNIGTENVFLNGLFVSPYNGQRSRIDNCQSEPNIMIIWIEKINVWLDSSTITISVSGKDEFGNDVLKTETVDTWE